MIEELRNKLKRFNQEHLLDFLNELDDEQKLLLINDIKSIDFVKVDQLFKEVSTDEIDCQSSFDNKLEPLNDQVYQSIKDWNDVKKDYYRQIGMFIKFNLNYN